MLESKFKHKFIKDLEDIFPGCIILHNDASLMPGIPDLLLLWNENWAMLEFKQSARASMRPNQAYYIGMLDDMSFAAVVYPENRDEVLDALQASFRAGRQARFS